MSLFSFLKSNAPTYSDKVWKEDAYAVKGMMTDALQAITRNEIPIVLTFFTDTSEKVRSFLTTNQVPYFSLEPGNASEAETQPRVVFLLDANFLLSSSQIMSFITNQSKKQKIDFLFFGHYPIPAKENRILEKLSSNNGAITFYSSLDDPSFKIFGADHIKETLSKIGLADDEAIQHTMVSRAMKNAREKIEKSIAHEIVCATELEWFSKNYKDRNN